MPKATLIAPAWLRRHSETLHLAAAAGLILLWTCVVRLPFLHIVNDDEAFFSVMGTRWLHGELPYVDSYDVKPPLLFAIYALAQAILGASLVTLKGLEIAFITAGAWLLYGLVQRQGSISLARWCAFLFPVYSLTLSGVNAGNSIVQLPFLIGAFAAFMQAAQAKKPAPWLLVSGLMIGMAGMVKQTAIFEAIGLAGLLIWTFRSHHPVKKLLVLVVGAAVPVLIFAVYFALYGHFSEFFDAVVVQSIARVNLDLPENKDNAFIGVVRFLPLIKPLILLALTSIMALVRLKRIEDNCPRLLLIVATIWAASSAIGVIALHAMFPYYALVLLAPLLILSGAFVLHGIEISAVQRKFLIAPIVAIFALVPLGLEHNTLRVTDHQGQDDFIVQQAAATHLKQLGLKSGEHILVLKRGLYVYVLTGTTPQARYYHNLHLMCPFPTSGPPPLTEALAQKPRFIVMADPTIWRMCETQNTADEVARALASGYDLKERISGSWDKLYIYQRRP